MEYKSCYISLGDTKMIFNFSCMWMVRVQHNFREKKEKKKTATLEQIFVHSPNSQAEMSKREPQLNKSDS